MSISPNALATPNPKVGILFKMMGIALFTPIFLAAKFSDGAYPVLALVAMRYIGGFLTMLVYIALTNTPSLELKSTNIKNHALRACFGIGGGAFMMLASTLMPVANATAIGLTQGILIIVFASLILKETITIRHWTAGIIALIGAILVMSQSVDLSSSGFKSWQGIIIAIIGALFMSSEALMIKFLSSRDNPLRMLLYVNGFGAVIASVLLVVLYGPQQFQQPTLYWFLALGPIAIISQYFNILANIRTNASTLAPIVYTWIIFASIIGYFAFNQIPTLLTFLGSGLIITGGIIIARAHR